MCNSLTDIVQCLTRAKTHTHAAQGLHALLCLFVHLINLLLVMLLQLRTLQFEGWGHEVVVHCTDTIEAIITEHCI